MRLIDAYATCCHTGLVMRVSTKLIIGLTAITAVVLGTHGVLFYEREEFDLKSVAELNIKLLATAIQVASESAFRDMQPEDIGRIVEAMEQRASDIDVFIFAPNEALKVSSPGSTPTLYLARRLAGQLGESRREITRYEKGPDGRSFLAIAQSMYRDSGGHGSLVIIRPLDELQKT